MGRKKPRNLDHLNNVEASCPKILCQEKNVYNWTHQIPFLEDGEVVIYTYEGISGTLNRESIENGIMLMEMNSPRHFNDMVSEGGDSTTADVLLQYSLFGEVVYG